MLLNFRHLEHTQNKCLPIFSSTISHTFRIYQTVDLPLQFGFMSVHFVYLQRRPCLASPCFFVFFFFVFKLSDSVFLGQSSAEYPARPPASCWTQKKSFLAAVGGIKYSRHTEILKSGQGEVFSNPITSANLICCCTRGKVANTALIAY